MSGLGVFLLLLLFSAPNNAQPQQTKPMTTDEILSRVAQALGGIERLRQVENVYQRGKLEVAGLTGTAEEWQTARGQHKQMIDLGEAYKNTVIFDGSRGWVVDRNNQISDLSGVPLEEEIATSYMGSYSFLIPGRLDGSVTSSGEDASGKFYVLQIKPAGGRPLEYYIDKSTFLPARIEVAKREGVTSTYLEDWRDADGIKVPFTYRQVEEDPGNNGVIKVEDVRVNGAIAAQTFAKPASNTRDFRFARGRNSASVPFDRSGNTIFLQARMNNSAPLWFILDTGSGASVIDARRARALKLKTSGKVQATVTGGSTELYFTNGVNFTLPGVKLLNQSVASINFGPELTQLKPNFGGVLGYDFISRFVVEIDYAKKTINLFDPQTYKYDGPGQHVPLTVETIPFAKAVVQMNGESVEGEFEIDTGFDGATLFNRAFVSANKSLQPSKQGPVSSRVGGGQGLKTESVTARIDGLTFGGVEFKNVITHFNMEEVGNATSKETAGLIGHEILRRFKVILDYSRQEMILEPNVHVSEPFEENMSGIELDAVGTRRVSFKVAGVGEGSPAEAADIRKGDTLVAIDGKPASSFSLEDINALFRQDGKEYSLTLRRGSKIVNAKIKTRRHI